MGSHMTFEEHWAQLTARDHTLTATDKRLAALAYNWAITDTMTAEIASDRPVLEKLSNVIRLQERRT